MAKTFYTHLYIFRDDVKKSIWKVCGKSPAYIESLLLDLGKEPYKTIIQDDFNNRNDFAIDPNNTAINIILEWEFKTKQRLR